MRNSNLDRTAKSRSSDGRATRSETIPSPAPSLIKNLWQRVLDVSIFHPARWPMLSVTAAVVVIGAAIAAAASWGLGLLVFGAASAQEWLRPGTATGDEGWLAPVKVALTVAAGVGAAVALVVAYRKQHQAERQEQREIARHYQDRFDAAVEQMGSKSATVRLAGAYALAGLADQSPGQRQQCIEVLCAHLRLPWNLEDAGALTSVQVQQPFGNRGTRTATYTTTPGEEEVRKTILRIIGRHLAAGRRRVWVDSDATSDLAPPWSIQMLDLAGATLPDLTWEGGGDSP